MTRFADPLSAEYEREAYRETYREAAQRDRAEDFEYRRQQARELRLRLVAAGLIVPATAAA